MGGHYTPGRRPKVQWRRILSLMRVGLGVAAQAFPGVGQAIGIATALAPARMFSGGGRSAAKLPGFNAGMKLNDETHFFTDSRGHEWSWNSKYGHLDPLGGNPKRPQVYQSRVIGTSEGYSAHARAGKRADAAVVRDLESLLQTGRLPARAPTPAPAPTPTRPRFTATQYWKAGYYYAKGYR